ncbi:MAG TPA: diacylglycerol kinase family protein [Methylomirabilota bacterium]|jgi:YegS/Rv2252/BmrU family lipid kinase
MTRAFVVINPAAGHGASRKLAPSILAALRSSGATLEVAETDAPGAATRLATRAAHAGWPLVLAVGGDGTVNEVVNGLIADDGRCLAAVGMINTGRGRDASRNLGLPTGVASVRRLLESERETAVDLGVVEWANGRRRYFVVAAGAGFDAAVAARAQGRAGRGTVAYVLAILASLRAHAPAPVTVTIDGGAPTTRRAAFVVCANGEYYGGGMKIAPGADVRDGVLDVVVVGNLGRLGLVRWLPSVYRGGHLRCPEVTSAKARSVLIESASPLAVHVDGEPEEGTPVRIGVRPGALRVRG